MLDQGNPLDLLAAASDPNSAIDRRHHEDEETIYPLPCATYEEVAANASLFMETLEKLHKSMGTKFMVPIMGGKVLDLYQLFLEVTSRGGLEKAIRDKMWREVIAVFNFPSTITNASFVLRKYYISLLHHYEQVYFFRTQGSPVASSVQNLAASLGASPVQATKRKRNRTSKAGSVMPENRTVKGIIDGKFEYGYLVTVTIGSERLKGVLYHASRDPQAALVMQSNGASASHTEGHRERKKYRHPKLKNVGYNFFFAEQYARLKPSYSINDSAISKKIGLLWSELTDDEKVVYQEKGLLDKERYKIEMVKY